jgi:hypothetical protein
VLHQPRQPDSGFAKVASDNTIVPNDQQWQSKLTCDRFRQRRFAVARWAGKKHSVSRLDRMRTK